MLLLGIFITQLAVLYILSKITTSLIFRKVKSLYVFWFLFLPGTIIHELSHLVMATVLAVPAGHLRLKPERVGEGRVKMGSVRIAKTDTVRRTLIGAAPAIFGIAIIFSLLYFASHNNLLTDWRMIVVIAYANFEIGNTMFASRSDLEGTYKFFLILAAVLVTFYLLGGRINIPDLPLDLLTRYLFVPIIVDLVIIFLLSL